MQPGVPGANQRAIGGDRLKPFEAGFYPVAHVVVERFLLRGEIGGSDEGKSHGGLLGRHQSGDIKAGERRRNGGMAEGGGRSAFVLVCSGILQNDWIPHLCLPGDP